MPAHRWHAGFIVSIVVPGISQIGPALAVTPRIAPASVDASLPHPRHDEGCRTIAIYESCDPRRPVALADVLLRDNLERGDRVLPALGGPAPGDVGRRAGAGHATDSAAGLRFSDPTAAKLSDRPAVPEARVRLSIEKVMRVMHPLPRATSIDVYA